jgi:hypothetical protein
MRLEARARRLPKGWGVSAEERLFVVIATSITEDTVGNYKLGNHI